MAQPDPEFLARFWDAKVRWSEAGDMLDDGRALRVEWAGGEVHHLVARPYVATPDGRILGFGGALQVFRLTSGEVVISNNVWHQGRVPDEYRTRLPVNAESLSCTCGRHRLVGGHESTLCVIGEPCERCELVGAFNPTGGLL